MVGNELMHCSDGVNNCDETGVDSGGSCSTHCSPASACNTQARYYCSAENEKDFTAYCDEANNCEHCGDGLVNCEEACDETSEGYVGNCDFSTFTYCSACTASKTYTPTDLFCTQCAAVSSAADGDADARYCSCKSGAWLNGGGDKNCCGDDGTTEAWAFETDQIRLCVNGASRKCEGQNEILPVDGTNYYCTKSGVLWVWGTDPCVSGDGNCYDATACGTIDEECKKGQGEACESTPQCKNTLACVDEAMDDVRVCCPEGTCAYNRQCVLEGAYGSYGCKAGSWYSCDATTACMQDESLMCSSSTNEWVPIPEYLGADAHGCDDSCTVGSRCPSNGACMLAQGESCSGNEQFCCDGQCSSGHCCPDESVWCTDACRTIIDISQPHDCTGCEALCPSGYACSSGLCMPTQSCEATSCPFGLACARDTAAENPTCCPTGTCWDLQANKCVASNTLDSTSQYACSNGQWVEYCSLTASNTNYKRECDSSCEADDACHGKSPATDYANYACTSSCASTNATASIFIEARRCNSTLLTDCLQEAGTTDLSIEEGMAVPVNFSVDYPDGVPRESNMTILLDGAVYNKTTGTGGTFLLQGLAPGEHVVNVTADHPDFLSNTTSARIWVEPDLESAILIATKPAKIAMEIGKPVDINVTLANKGKTNYTFAVATSLDARHASSVVAEGGRTTTLAMQILSPTQLGEVPFNITFTAPEGAVLYKAVITVFPEVKHEISLASSVSNGLYALQIENTGTVQEILRVAGCGKNETLVVASGETESLELGALSGSCTICGENSLVKKCKVVEPVQFSLSVPPTVAARVGEAGSILFKTTASKTGSITVRSNSDLFPEFSCQATCEQELSFLPSKVGQTSVTFTAVWPQYGMEAVGTTQIIVSQVFETANDQQALETSIADIGARIQKLEDAGIRVDAIKGIYDAVKLIDTSSPQGVAQAVSELERAKKYLRYAEDTGVPEAREFPLLQAIAGVVAVAVAAGLLYTVMPKHPAHPDVPHSEVHHDQPAQAAAAKTVKGPDGKTYTIPPGGQLVRLPNGQITVVPAGMTVGRTPDGRYQLVRKTA